MSKRRKPPSRRPGGGWNGATDPRRAGGDIAGPGGPHDRNAVVIDAERAVLLQHVDVAQTVFGRRQDDGSMSAEWGLVLMLSGRINKTAEASRVVYATDMDGAAGIISEIIGLVERSGPEFTQRLASRLDEMGVRGWRSYVPPPPPS